MELGLAQRELERAEPKVLHPTYLWIRLKCEPMLGILLGLSQAGMLSSKYELNPEPDHRVENVKLDWIYGVGAQFRLAVQARNWLIAPSNHQNWTKVACLKKSGNSQQASHDQLQSMGPATCKFRSSSFHFGGPVIGINLDRSTDEHKLKLPADLFSFLRASSSKAITRKS